MKLALAWVAQFLWTLLAYLGASALQGAPINLFALLLIGAVTLINQAFVAKHMKEF